MSAAEEDLIPVMFGETPITNGTTMLVTSGAGVFPGEEGLSGLGVIPKYFGRAQARITTWPAGLEWGRFSMDTTDSSHHSPSDTGNHDSHTYGPSDPIDDCWARATGDYRASDYHQPDCAHAV
ncbi:UNVERIFIED_CONTAM: hypothetical protein K2H54_059640 [Gekko kuhli]